MIIHPTPLEGVLLIEHKPIFDPRGVFLKYFEYEAWADAGLPTAWVEMFVTKSTKNVLRGMHFQEPPADHHKIITVLDGEILDVALDIRRTSKTFGKTFSISLSVAHPVSLFLPKGLAHGFLTLASQAIVHYATTSSHCPAKDRGILWNSFGFLWPLTNPIISERDRNHPSFGNFQTPFS